MYRVTVTVLADHPDNRASVPLVADYAFLNVSDRNEFVHDARAWGASVRAADEEPVWSAPSALQDLQKRVRQ